MSTGAGVCVGPLDVHDQGGIFPGMISRSDPEVVVSELGDKVVGALVHAVRIAKHHLHEYRRQHPDWAVATHLELSQA
jgi:hypothetical protein